VKLVPDIIAKLGSIPPSKPLGEEQDKMRFYEAVTQLFISICTESPLVLLFDDMQWADQSSLDLLEYFVRSSGSLRVLTTCCYRSEDFQPDSPSYKSLMKLNRQRVLETIQVKNLSREETVEQIKRTFGEQTITPEFADLIYGKTGGNPFFVEEILRSLVEDGSIFRTETKWDRKPIQEIILPETVRSVLKSRLTKLQPDTLNVLTMASVVGSEFDFEVLREASQLDEDTLLQRLEKAFSAGLLQQIPHQRSLFKFTDDRIRELLLNDLIPIRRAKYHIRIAGAIEKVHSKNLERNAEEIANHYSDGGDIEHGIRYCAMAGNRNKAIHAYEQAIKNYKLASELIDLEGGRDEEKAVLLEYLGDCYSYAGRFRESTEYYEQALSVFEKLNNHKKCASVCVGLSSSIHSKGFYAALPDAIQVLKRGLKYIEGEPESFEAALIYSMLARNHGALEEWDEANGWSEKALVTGEKSGNHAAVAGALAWKGSYLTDTGRIDEGLPLWEKAYDVASQHELYDQAFTALGNLNGYVYPRDLAKARDMALRCFELSNRANDLAGQANMLARLSLLDWLRGDWATASDEVEKAFRTAERLGFRLAYYPEACRALLPLSMGDFEQAEIYIQNAFAKQDTKGNWTVAKNLVLAELRLEQDEEQEAERLLETCVDTFKDREYDTFPLFNVEALLHITSLYAKHGEFEKACEASERTKRIAEQLRSDAALAMASQAEASLLLASGDRNGAAEAFKICLALWEKAGWPYYQAKAMVAYSDAIANASPDESRKHLEEASEIFRKLGAKRNLERILVKFSVR
jgi:tetratricopeptide (TPR) repeat protein